LLGLLTALLLHQVLRRVDLILGWQAQIGPEGARAVLAALASSMLTFIVFVFSILLVAVQLASAQLTPRIIALVYRNPVLKVSLTFFVFAFTYTLAVLSRTEATVPQISVWVAVYSCVVCIVLFVYMIDNVGKSLRPISFLTRIGGVGQTVINEVYPHPITGTEDVPTNVALVPPGEPSRTVPSMSTGAVLAFDEAGLVDLARRLPDRARSPGWRFRDSGGPALSLVPRGGGHRRPPAAPGGRHRAGTHHGAGPDLRVSHRRRHRRQGTLARHQ
jgi:uncharacterized membrane protein